jgi:hypothetical protein
MHPDAIAPMPRPDAVAVVEAFQRLSPPGESKKRRPRSENKHGNTHGNEQRDAARPVRRTNDNKKAAQFRHKTPKHMKTMYDN